MNKWISEKQASIKRETVLQLLEIYQNRQISNLDLHQKFTNYYSGLLSALLAAFMLGFAQFHNEVFSCLLGLLPLTSIILAYHAKLAMYRYYRRYIEDRVRVQKIEHILGLDGAVNPSEIMPSGSLGSDLWPNDEVFLPERYIFRGTEYKDSGTFIKARSKQGIGLITQHTMNLFLIISWACLLLLPIVLPLVRSPADRSFAWIEIGPLKLEPSCVLMSTLCALIGLISMWHYIRSNKKSEKELETENAGN